MNDAAIPTTMLPDSTQSGVNEEKKPKELKKKRKKRGPSKSRKGNKNENVEPTDTKKKKKSTASKKVTTSYVNDPADLTNDTKKDDRVSSNLDLTKPLFPIAHYIDDREEMLQQAFMSTTQTQLEAMMPDILKECSAEVVKALCLGQLEGMSKKRIYHILEGEDMISSSDTDESVDEVDQEELPDAEAPPPVEDEINKDENEVGITPVDDQLIVQEEENAEDSLYTTNPEDEQEDIAEETPQLPAETLVEKPLPVLVTKKRKRRRKRGIPLEEGEVDDDDGSDEDSIRDEGDDDGGSSDDGEGMKEAVKKDKKQGEIVSNDDNNSRVMDAAISIGNDETIAFVKTDVNIGSEIAPPDLSKDLPGAISEQGGEGMARVTNTGSVSTNPGSGQKSLSPVGQNTVNPDGIVCNAELESIIGDNESGNHFVEKRQTDNQTTETELKTVSSVESSSEEEEDVKTDEKKIPSSSEKNVVGGVGQPKMDVLELELRARAIRSLMKHCGKK